MSASSVADGKFTVTVSIPAASWNTFLFEITYNHSAVQASDATHSSGAMVVSNTATGNTTGTYKVNGMVVMPVTAVSTLTIPFEVKDTSATSVTISLAVSDFASGATQIERTAPSPVTVTLKTQSSVTPPPSPSTNTNTTTNTSSTTDTPSDTPTDTSTPTSTKTDPTTSTKTDSAGKTSSKNPSTKTDTDTGTLSDTVTDSESLTDTETNFPISDTATDTETDVTDVTDTTTEENSGSWFSTVITATEDKPNNMVCLSPGTIALISIGIAVVFCGALTAMGLLRRKKDTENQ